MTIEQAVKAQLPRERFEVMSGKDVLGSIQFLPWQDGAVLIVRGKFQIEMLLLFLRATKPDIKPEHLQSFRGPDVQVSFVLPITWQQFMQTLGFFQGRSNMRIERHDPKGVVQKFGDEGTSTPFIARLMLGVMHIRNAAYDEIASRLCFDELYGPVCLVSAMRARRARKSQNPGKTIKKEWTLEPLRECSEEPST